MASSGRPSLIPRPFFHALYVPGYEAKEDHRSYIPVVDVEQFPQVCKIYGKTMHLIWG